MQAPARQRPAPKFVVTLQVRLTPRLYEAVKDEADEELTSASHVVRRAVHAYLKQKGRLGG